MGVPCHKYAQMWHLGKLKGSVYRGVLLERFIVCVCAI